MASRVGMYGTDRITSDGIGQLVDELVKTESQKRKSFERRWYDNNFFDDGFHFRYLSRQDNKVVDLTDRSTIYNPIRAIPKASRQIRGVANLLMSTEPTPIIYPEKVNFASFPPVEVVDPQTGQVVQQENPELAKAKEIAKNIAKLSGHWLTEEWHKQELLEKLALMVILASKQGISYLKVWPDAKGEAIKTQVYDAFDVILDGSLTEVSEVPFIATSMPRRISAIKADPRFPKEKTDKISPDNRMASSEIKEAYMKARYGGFANPEAVATLIEKEVFIKEFLTDENMPRIRAQKNGQEILNNKGKGDYVIRHSFVEGNVEVLDEYIKLNEYPLVDFRFEPGPLYQVPLIERFIPANKSLDLIASRVERYTHSMVVGSWSKKQGEQFEITNSPNGQVIEYTNTPPIQNPIASIPSFVFNFMNFLTGLMEEQGVTTTSLGKLPSGVKAHAAIESLKESEYSNLSIPLRRLRGTVKRASERMLDLADDYIVSPQDVYYLEKGEPQYFSVIGNSAIAKRKAVKVETPADTIPLRRECRVEIEVQQGVAYTREGTKAAALDFGNWLLQAAQTGAIPPQAIKVFFEKLLDMYGFGATQEIMEAVNQFQDKDVDQDNIDQMKVAIAEVMSDLQKGGVLSSPEERIEEGKVATAEVVADLAGGQNAV